MGLEDNNFSWVWKLHCHNRIKMFVWKILINGLPLNSNLSKRGLPIHDLCPLCGSSSETTDHLLRACSTVAFYWRVSGLPLPNNPNSVLFLWVKSNAKSSILSHFNIPTGTLFLYSIWHLWKARNKKIFESSTFSPHSILHQLKNMAAEFHYLASPSPNAGPSNTIAVQWIPPPSNTLKINTDCSHNNDSHCIAAGGIIRDHRGSWVCGFSKFIGRGDALLAELWGIFLGTKFCLERNFFGILFETDSLLAFNLIKDMNISSAHYLGHLIFSCRSGLLVQLIYSLFDNSLILKIIFCYHITNFFFKKNI